jgi:hypothetical protein
MKKLASILILTTLFVTMSSEAFGQNVQIHHDLEREATTTTVEILNNTAGNVTIKVTVVGADGADIKEGQLNITVNGVTKPYVIEDNFDDSETYFYAAVCLLNGKKAFLNQRPTIDKVLEYINAALMIEPKGIYYYYLAYIKYDYFERKHFRTTPNYREALQMAVDAGLSDFDIEQLFAILGVARPDCI